MTRFVFKDKNNKFSTVENAVSFIEVDDKEWKSARPFEELESAIRLIEKTEIIEKEPDEEYDEYVYFVGFNYETPSATIDGSRTSKGQKGLHDFKTEFKVFSPTKLTQSDLREAIKSDFSTKPEDYSGVLKNKGAYQYEIKDTVNNKVKKPVSIKAEKTEEIER